MKLNEINNKNWIVSKDFQIDETFVQNIPNEEQEMHLNVSKFDDCIFVDCTYTRYITKLSKCSSFKLSNALVSCKKNSENDILGVQGVLNIKSIIIRKTVKKSVKMNDEEKRKLLEILNKNNKKKN